MSKIGTRVDIVYNYLLEEILRGKYSEGNRILISEVAQACDVSNTPVREALRRLESDGYVKIMANQGAVSLGFPRAYILETFEVKGVLEGYAARISIDYLSENDFRNMESINERMIQAARSGNKDESSRLNIEFHMYMYKKCPYPVLLGMIDELWRKWSITKNVFPVVAERSEETYQEHKEIIRLARSRSYDALEQFIRSHKANSIASMTTQFPVCADK